MFHVNNNLSTHEYIFVFALVPEIFQLIVQIVSVSSSCNLALKELHRWMTPEKVPWKINIVQRLSCFEIKWLYNADCHDLR